MAIDFGPIETTLEATKAEVAQYDASVEALNGAKGELVAAQSAVAEAQVAVTAATETTSAEKADVVAGITSAITQLNAILTDLQG